MLINKFLKSHNCKYQLAKGYGMTEMLSRICVTPINVLRVKKPVKTRKSRLPKKILVNKKIYTVCG